MHYLVMVLSPHGMAKDHKATVKGEKRRAQYQKLKGKDFR